jgi:hypothetical protein
MTDALIPLSPASSRTAPLPGRESLAPHVFAP